MCFWNIWLNRWRTGCSMIKLHLRSLQEWLGRPRTVFSRPKERWDFSMTLKQSLEHFLLPLSWLHKTSVFRKLWEGKHSECHKIFFFFFRNCQMTPKLSSCTNTEKKHFWLYHKCASHISSTFPPFSWFSSIHTLPSRIMETPTHNMNFMKIIILLHFIS